MAKGKAALKITFPDAKLVILALKAELMKLKQAARRR